MLEAFQAILLLRHYDPTLPLRMETDTSSIAYTGILSLFYEGVWYLIAYYSKKFSRAEVYYSIYDKELLAIV